MCWQYQEPRSAFVDWEDAVLPADRERWEALKSEIENDDQRLLAFARLALHKPRWVVIDEALDALPDVARKRVLSVFEQDLG